MKSLVRFLVAFLAVTGAVAILTGVFGVEFGQASFWDRHGVLFLVALMIFPRLTLLFSSVASGGLLWWLSWFFAPRILVAVLATMAFWAANPFLVVCAWLVAFGGESSEKYYMVRSSGRGFQSARWVDAKVKDPV